MQRTYVLDTPAFCPATRRRSPDSTSTRWCCRSLLSPSSKPNERTPNLGTSARQRQRLLDDLRISNGAPDEPVGLPDGGTLVGGAQPPELHVLPSGFQSGDNDSRILVSRAVVCERGRNVVLIASKDPDAGQGFSDGAGSGGVPSGARDYLRRTGSPNLY